MLQTPTNIGTYGHDNFLFLKPFQLENRYMKACNFNRNPGLLWVCARMIMGGGILSSCLREENKHLINRTEVVCFLKPFIDATKS